MSTFLFEKEVDQSLLKSGLTIPIDAQQGVQDAVGVQLSKGEKAEINILIEGKLYNAILTNINFGEKYSNRVVLQIRYAEGSPICQKLQALFSLVSLDKSNTNKEFIKVYSVDNKALELKVKNDLKIAFFNYIGPADSLAGYQRSYKLVFLKSFFTRLLKKQDTTCDLITSDFQQFYIQRKNAGLVPDIDADKIIENIEDSTLTQVFDLILRNPFNAISSHGFMIKESGGVERFVLNSKLSSQLSSTDIETIIHLVDQKLENYYLNKDNVIARGKPMREIIEKIMNEYVPAQSQPFADHPLGVYFRNDIPRKLYDTNLVDSNDYSIVGSVGKGKWAMIPWICILDPKAATSPTNGVYIVFLLTKEGNSLYLTFNQGCTAILNNHSKSETIEIMRANATEITSKIDARGFHTDEDINLGDGLSARGYLYQRGTIFYKEYKKGAIPEEKELQNDLTKMMDIYREYVDKFITQKHKTWLISWNPKRWEWKDYLDAVHITQTGSDYKQRWSCVNTHVMPGDRVFLTVLGSGDKNGIIASGVAVSKSFEGDHWDSEKQAQGIKINRIEVSFDLILDYLHQDILQQSVLNSLFPDQQWSPQGSGIEINAQYVQRLEEEWEKIKRAGGEEKLTVKETVEHIKAYIGAKGFSYQDGLIENFFLSLKAKPFVILAGTSGTGKTRLVRMFAEAVGANVNNGRYKMVSVRPDWSDSSDLFGHVDLNGRFIPGVIIDFIKRAELDSVHSYFLCLDEMNLARVEYYLSDFLSAVETRDFQDGHIVSEPLVTETYYGRDGSAAGKYGTVRFPDNLYVIGTVNMDETTFPFSRKVLDRANTIEFSFVDLMPPTEWTQSPPAPMDIGNSFLKTEYLLLVQCENQQEDVNSYCVELQNLNQILQQANAHVGYRIRDEIIFYLLNNKSANLLPENVAMDNAIMQKILPRIQGSSASIKKMLCELFRICAGDYEGQNTESDLSSKMMKVAQKPNCQYPKSAQKIAFMVRRFEEDGFTSYWL